MSEDQTDLYRMRDEGGTLLYVGISLSAASRAAQHRKTQPWWPQTARIEVEQFESRHEALSAEREAIHGESPLYNVTGKPRQREPAPSGKSASKQREWTERRNRDICEDHQQGWSLGRIAEATGLSKSAVANIVNRQTDR